MSYDQIIRFLAQQDRIAGALEGINETLKSLFVLLHERYPETPDPLNVADIERVMADNIWRP